MNLKNLENLNEKWIMEKGFMDKNRNYYQQNIPK